MTRLLKTPGMSTTNRLTANHGLGPNLAASPEGAARSGRFGRVARGTNRNVMHPLRSDGVYLAPVVPTGPAAARSGRGAVSDTRVARAALSTADASGGSRSLPEQIEQLKAALRKLLAAVLQRTLGMALDKVEQMSRTFDDIAARGGFKVGALLGGVRAAVAGRNPVWGAIKGAFSALSPEAKAALVLVLVLALLLLPVTVVLLLILVIVVAVVATVQTRSRTP